MERQLSLLERYRRDRRQLIQFLLSSGLIKEIRTSFGPVTSLSNIDYDSLSADYILHCVKSGFSLFLPGVLFGFRFNYWRKKVLIASL